MKLFILTLLALVSTAKASETGYATYYADRFNGRVTASGEIFSQSKLTCASNKYKFGTKLKVTNLANGKSVICHVNDTGGFGRYGVAVDLSKKAFTTISPLHKGKIKVKVERYAK